MGFLIRAVFWLSLVFLFLPIGTGGQTSQQEETVGPMQALFAAREAVQDLAGICDRQPDVCATARAAVSTIMARAKESLRFAEALTSEDSQADQPAENVAPQVQPATTGSVAPAQ